MRRCLATVLRIAQVREVPEAAACRVRNAFRFAADIADQVRTVCLVQRPSLMVTRRSGSRKAAALVHDVASCATFKRRRRSCPARDAVQSKSFQNCSTIFRIDGARLALATVLLREDLQF